MTENIHFYYALLNFYGEGVHSLSLYDIWVGLVFGFGVASIYLAYLMSAYMDARKTKSMMMLSPQKFILNTFLFSSLFFVTFMSAMTLWFTEMNKKSLQALKAEMVPHHISEQGWNSWYRELNSGFFAATKYRIILDARGKVKNFEKQSETEKQEKIKAAKSGYK